MQDSDTDPVLQMAIGKYTRERGRTLMADTLHITDAEDHYRSMAHAQDKSDGGDSWKG